MQAAYRTPAVPTWIDMLLPAGKSPDDGKPGPLLAPPVVLEGVVPRLATDGDFEPPHPDASNARPARAQARTEERTLEVRISAEGSTPL
jgi:hypothetical protein